MNPKERVLSRRPNWLSGRVGRYWYVICGSEFVESSRSESHAWLLALELLEKGEA